MFQSAIRYARVKRAGAQQQRWRRNYAASRIQRAFRTRKYGRMSSLMPGTGLRGRYKRTPRQRFGRRHGGLRTWNTSRQTRPVRQYMASRTPSRTGSVRTLRNLFRTGQHVELQYWGMTSTHLETAAGADTQSFGAAKTFGRDKQTGNLLSLAFADIFW